VDECKALPPMVGRTPAAIAASICIIWAAEPGAIDQGLTLVHVSALLERILLDRGAFRGCLGGVQEVTCQGVLRCIRRFRVYFVSETAQVELRRGHV